MPASSQEQLALIYSLLAFCSGLAGAFVGAYIKRKGENLATKEDVAKITRITEEVRSELATKTWQTQRWWDEKRTIYADMIRGLNQIADGLWNIINQGFDPTTGEKTPERLPAGSVDRILHDIDGYLQNTGVAYVFLSPTAHKIIAAWGESSKTLYEKLAQDGNELSYYTDLKSATDQAYNRLIDVARQDLKGELDGE